MINVESSATATMVLLKRPEFLTDPPGLFP